MKSQRADEHIVDVWFRLKDQMIDQSLPQQASAVRPPSLRDAAYAYVLAHRASGILTSEETIESYINGLELGAMAALRPLWDLWKLSRQSAEAMTAAEQEAPSVQGPSEDL
jgi:hypothetical protein